MSKYTITCTSCEYKIGFNMNYVPNVEEKVCDACGAPLQAVEVSSMNTNNSAVLVSGVGEINSRLPGDFRNLMQSIKKGSKNCNMKDYE